MRKKQLNQEDIILTIKDHFNFKIMTDRITLTPTGTKIIVVPDTVSKKSAGGIILPDTYKKKEFTGTIETVSLKISDLIKPGERILYYEYDLQELPYNGEIYLALDYRAFTILPE